MWATRLLLLSSDWATTWWATELLLSSSCCEEAEWATELLELTPVVEETLWATKLPFMVSSGEQTLWATGLLPSTSGWETEWARLLVFSSWLGDIRLVLSSCFKEAELLASPSSFEGSEGI